MLFSPFFAGAALFVSAVVAMPTPGSLEITGRDVGPSGSVITPVGNTNFPVGGAIHFQYQRAVTDIAQTSSVDIRLVTFDGKVTENANNISLASFLTSADGSGVIDAWLRIPPLVSLYPGENSWVAQLQVTETQVGSLGAAPFLAAAPRITIGA